MRLIGPTTAAFFIRHSSYQTPLLVKLASSGEYFDVLNVAHASDRLTGSPPYRPKGDLYQSSSQCAKQAQYRQHIETFKILFRV